MMPKFQCAIHLRFILQVQPIHPMSPMTKNVYMVQLEPHTVDATTHRPRKAPEKFLTDIG